MVGQGVPFFEALARRQATVDSLLCVGLDPHLREIEAPTAEAAKAFCVRLIECTKHVAACYKPNAAFFEQFGSAGWRVLEELVEGVIPPEIPVIFDAKRGDIGSTSAAYAVGNFRVGSALTVSPYLGGDGVLPFVDTKEKTAFVLCKTSNPGSADLQSVILESSGDPLYLHVAGLCALQWGSPFGNVGLVVGATDVEALRRIRERYPHIWFLSPGVGAQGASLEAALHAGLSAEGSGILIPISRGISKAADPKEAADRFHEAINLGRKKKRLLSQ